MCNLLCKSLIIFAFFTSQFSFLSENHQYRGKMPHTPQLFWTSKYDLSCSGMTMPNNPKTLAIRCKLKIAVC